MHACTLQYVYSCMHAVCVYIHQSHCMFFISSNVRKPLPSLSNCLKRFSASAMSPVLIFPCMHVVCIVCSSATDIYTVAVRWCIPTYMQYATCSCMCACCVYHASSCCATAALLRNSLDTRIPMHCSLANTTSNVRIAAMYK
jgi:hypothetical protein